MFPRERTAGAVIKAASLCSVQAGNRVAFHSK